MRAARLQWFQHWLCTAPALRRTRGSSWEHAKNPTEGATASRWAGSLNCWLVACLGGVRNKYVHFISFSASYHLPRFYLLPCLNMKYVCFICVALFRENTESLHTQVCVFLLFFYGHLGYPKPVTHIHA